MSTHLRTSVAARLERLPDSRYLRTAVILISLGTFWDSYMLFSVGPISAHFFAYLGQPHLATELPLALFLGTFVGAVCLSTVADTIGRRAAFTLDLCTLAVGALVAAFSPNATVLLIALFVAGIGTGAELPLSTTYVQELSPAKARGKKSSFALTIGFFGGTVGGFASLLLVPLTNLPIQGFRIALLLAALGGFSSLLLRIRLPESPRWLERVGRHEEADRVVEEIERRVMRDTGLTALPPVPAGSHDVASGASPLRILISRAYLRRTISAGAIELLQGFGAYGFATFVPFFLYSRGYSVIHALAYTAIIQISYPTGCLISAYITDRIQRKWGMALAYTINVVFGLCFLLVDSTFLIVLFGFLTETMIFINGPLLHTYEAEIYPTGVRARGAGICFALSRLGGFLAPIVASILLAGGANGGWLIAIGAAAWFGCALVAAFVAVDTTNISLEDLEAKVGDASEADAAAGYGMVKKR
ncbi:sugar (and other) transporter family protein [Paraburkholderia xenovorans LB400]|uniref:Major facilitator superfamily (MFS) transporter n=1 Tax=Paraburkholderia xenovorans (strain LB400) TaxID=266265 RepID=Q13H73_PARXL|nr:MFS transporter [Paraburkholderia xenovorans]ABE36566.1 major facilitator superfamily (MFS) transporter [Paraburkholderia xenovorans LB400]AIP35106.1 sugar (and other) transporter family protein [Paraburkholderia xenovorans LB400]